MDAKNRQRSAPQATHVIRMEHLPGIVGTSRSTIYRQEAEGLFPKRRKIGKKAVGWLRSEVEEWLASREIADSTNSHFSACPCKCSSECEARTPPEAIDQKLSGRVV